MSKISTADLKHFDRIEEKEILDFVNFSDKRKHVSIFGLSGVGKTELVTSSIRFLHKENQFKRYTILHYDASNITDEYTKELFYNLLIYKLLQKADSNEINQTYVEEANTFLAFLEKETYKEEVKKNAKRALISSLSLLPTVGPLIYKLLNSEEITPTKEYHTNQYLFYEYLNYLSKATGIIAFIDNIQCLSKELANDFLELFRQVEGRVLLFTSVTIKDDEVLTKKLIETYRLNSNALVLRIENITLDAFNEICKQNLNTRLYFEVVGRIEYFYELVQYGNMREVDELIFQITQNGIASISGTPTLQGIRALDEIKKDILNLVSLFPEGIKLSFIEKIIRYNYNCTDAELQQSIFNLCKMKYTLIGENDTLQVKHEKITQASKQNLELVEEEERFAELIYSCKKVFSDIMYETMDDSDFIFCINGLMELEQQFDLFRNLGAIEKYINILYSNFWYFQICQLYRDLSTKIKNGEKITLLFPICSLIQILDSFQKTSNFSEGLAISNQLSSVYNMDLYKAKFLLQSYHYKETIEVLQYRLNNYESWSIYLNALQHLRRDIEVKRKIEGLMGSLHQYLDVEFYYIILRNSGHLFKFETAITNLQNALEYFQKNNNKFVVSTCFNNIGILYLYHKRDKSSIGMARTHFKHAQTIMHQIKSNEEYQSLINIGVSYACDNNAYLALEYFEQAQVLVPSNLTFDIIKLQCNILICKYMLSTDEKYITDVRGELLELCSRSENLPDPWIKLLCTYNLYVLRGFDINNCEDLKENYPGDIRLYGLIINSAKGRFMLGVSPHWRY